MTDSKTAQTTEALLAGFTPDEIVRAVDESLKRLILSIAEGNWGDAHLMVEALKALEAETRRRGRGAFRDAFSTAVNVPGADGDN